MIRFFILLVFVTFLFSSCVTNYGVAHRTYPSKKLPIPYAEGKDTSAFYVGAAYSSGNQYYWQATRDRSPFFWQPSQITINSLEDNHYSYSLNAHYGSRVKNLYFGAGIIGYKGVYDLRSIPIEEIQGDLDFWGTGATSELGLTFELGDFRIRPFGAKLTAIYEGGQYADFKGNFLDTMIGNTLYRNENADNIQINASAVLGGSYHTGNWDLGLDVVLGVSDEDIALGITSYVAYKKLYLLLNCTTEHTLGRYSLSGGLMYRF